MSPRCVLCGQSLDSTEANVSIPDLQIEMHEACYRLYLAKGRRDAQHPKC